MAVSKELLDILVCPETKLDLSPADDATVKVINEKIRCGAVVTRGGKKVAEAVDGALFRADGKVFYVIRDDIPVMLIDEAILADAVV